MEIDVDNFESEYKNIEKAILESDFVSFDFEFSGKLKFSFKKKHILYLFSQGIQLNNSNLKIKYDSLEDCYQIVKAVVSNYAVL